MQFFFDFYFEVISFFASVFFYVQKRNKIPLYFIPFLFTTVTVELIGGWCLSNAISNYALFNVFTTCEFLFYSFFFYMHFERAIFRKMVLFFIPVFILSVVLNMLLGQGWNKTFNTYTFLSGSFFIVIFCCCYFYESVLPENIDVQLGREPFFWIASGLLIFYLGSVIINALFEYLRSNDLQEQGIRIYGFINHSLNVILYSSFCVAFYLCPNNRKTSSSPS